MFALFLAILFVFLLHRTAKHFNSRLIKSTNERCVLSMSPTVHLYKLPLDLFWMTIMPSSCAFFFWWGFFSKEWCKGASLLHGINRFMHNTLCRVITLTKVITYRFTAFRASRRLWVDSWVPVETGLKVRCICCYLLFQLLGRVKILLRA